MKIKIHCSVLAEDAIKTVIHDYQSKHKSVIKESCSDGQKVKVLIDPKSIMFILGSEMDYRLEKFSSGFVFKNLNEKGKYDCGERLRIV
ncbi:hypothetical protein QQG55_2265 [Brugia pahangi]